MQSEFRKFQRSQEERRHEAMKKEVKKIEFARNMQAAFSWLFGFALVLFLGFAAFAGTYTLGFLFNALIWLGIIALVVYAFKRRKRFLLRMFRNIY